MIKTIIFDFFDVFRTDSYKTWLVRNNYERTGAFAEASILADQGTISESEFYDLISKAAGRLVTPEEVDSTAELNEEMVSFARDLKKTYHTSLLSNSPSTFIRNLLRKHGLDDIFDDIFISGETGYIKPHADTFQNALETMDVKASEVLFIDDNPVNVASAEELGIQSLLFTTVDQLKIDMKDMQIKL